MKAIQSRDNPTVKHLRALAEDARYRRSEGASVLDGVHLVEAALQAGIALRRIAVTEAALQRVELADLLDRLDAGCERLLLSETAMRHASPVTTPVGVVAEIALPEPAVLQCDTDLVVCEAVQDSGNLGTLLRTAAAAGISQVLVDTQCAQAWSPKVLRAGMGAHFALRIVEADDLVAALAGWTIPVRATTLDATESLHALDLRGPAVWLFGSEGQGLSPALQTRADSRVRVPMPGRVESLNVAAAAAVCLFEQVRQRS